MNAVSGSTTETEAFGLLSPARTLRPPPHVIVDLRSPESPSSQAATMAPWTP
ncbi:hypothetical protein PC121_g9185 [Phytophthora cactorum]|nr:hypothetical protein PC120_g14024 [Phytophthora cactorum]KAG3071587.1 hypothetical protein PC121_g9185 [Phytophthora cactorum]KAG4051243.1 hypothetical protein PC123_g13538 [Phytophthora cactorum]